MDSAEYVKAHCNECGHETNHDCLMRDVDNWSDEDSPVWSRTTNSMLKCRGCGSIKLRRDYCFSEWDSVQTDYFPPAVSRKEPNWKHKLKDDIANLLSEIYSALHADSRTLAVMGARAIIDRVLSDKTTKVGRFAERLTLLEKKGFISARNAEVLAAALDAGHAAAHRAHTASPAEVNDIMDIVENLLHAVYLNAPAAARLRKTTPKQPRRRKKKTP